LSSHLISLSFLLTASAPVVDSVRISLESTSDKWFIRLLVSTGVVAIGCVLEIGETWTDLRRWIRLRRGLPVAEENPTSWHVPAGAIGLMLVIFGVIGEGIFEAYVSTSDTALRLHDEQIVAETRKQAAETYERAAGAMREAESAKLDAEDAKIRAKGANDKSDQETAKREELGAKIAEREITDKQQKDIGAACANLDTYGSKKRILVRSYGMDKEGADLATDIGKSLNSANLFTQINTGDIQTGVLDTGVLVFGPPEDEAFTSCLAKALVDIGKLTEVSVNGESHMGSKTSGTVKFFGTTKFMGGSTVVSGGFRAPGSQIDVLVGRRPPKIK
jgi:hypothetical protein